jgi:hypothetical protein
VFYGFTHQDNSQKKRGVFEMKRALSILLPVLFIAVYGSVMAAPAAPGGGGTSQVTVVNTAANPVPITAANPVPVNIQNQPTVNIGTLPSVNVSNQPTVNINGIPTVKVVQDIEPFQRFGSCTINDNERECNDEYIVPTGKRLVIEYFSCQAGIFTGQNLMCLVGTVVGDHSAFHALPITPLVTAESGQHYNSAGQLIKVYADSGTTVTFRIRRNGSFGSCLVVNSISGYLVNSQ